jgi:hypothetical protein
MQASVSLVAWCGMDRAKTLCNPMYFLWRGVERAETCMQASVSLVAWCGMDRAKTCMQASVSLMAWRSVACTDRKPVCTPMCLSWRGPL